MYEPWDTDKCEEESTDPAKLSALGVFVNQRQRELQISRKQVCDRTKVNQGLLSKLCRGIGKPSMETLFRLSAGLEVDPVELFKITNRMEMWETAEQAWKYRAQAQQVQSA